MNLCDEIRQIVEEVVEAAVKPAKRWGCYETCREMFGLSRPLLIRLADEGVIRCCKTSDADQAGAYYRISDIEDWMEERAEKLKRPSREEQKGEEAA